jgi:hypothetical protein
VEFADGTETWEVIPGFLRTSEKGYNVYEIPGAASGWIYTSPRAHLDYVTEVNQETKIKGAAKTLARYAKAWKHYNDVPMSSFYLEMQAARYISGDSSFYPILDLGHLLRRMADSGLAPMRDPQGLTGQFYACSSEANKGVAVRQIKDAAEWMDKAADAYFDGAIATAFAYLDMVFNDEFPAY